MTNIKIGNIEYKDDEIVYIKENEYYKAQDRLINEGYHKNKNGSFSKGCITIHPSCFKDKKVKCTLAFIKWNRNHDEFNILTCGLRPFNLNKEESKHFNEVLHKIEKNINKDYE